MNEVAGSQSSLTRRGVLLVGVVALVVGAVLSAQWLYFRLTHVSTDAAYVKAEMAEVAPEVAGRVMEVLVAEGEPIQAGQVLVRLEKESLTASRQQAEAAVAQLEETVRRQEATLNRTKKTVATAEEAAKAGVEAAQAQVAKASAYVDYLEKQENRLAALLAEQAVPKARYEELHAAAEAARADLRAAQEALRVAEAKLQEARAARWAVAEAESGLAEARSGLERARAALAQAQWAESRSELRAPFSGVVARIFLRAGDFAAPGRPVLALYDPRTRYVEARFEETKVLHLVPGKEAQMTVDALPGKRLRGRIRRVTPAAAQEFALIPRDVTAGEFTKVTQRVPVELTIEGVEQHPEIVPGLSVVVSVRKGS
ncbi:MAG: HlyD family secretion protein [Thermoanaerobaculum sp.]|nr:HlyD family secretion protein [Thermoanaerobaculum sp.]MDW7966834.1 HlyD family secretion protein [Thermoanaerobaculum sp.]